MGKVVFDISMSLDGFMTAANQRPEEPMGDGGQQLHQWAFGDDRRDRAVLTDGIASIGAVIAGRRTRAAAGEKGVTVMGGAQTGQQFLAAGLVDELSLHVVPVLFGPGTRMFENLGDTHIALEPLAAIQTPRATHLRLRIAR